MVGGHDLSGSPRLDGGLYDGTVDSWAPIPATSEEHEWGVGVCVNGELILWGGQTNSTTTNTGERWKP
jgi:hypothetical protein